MVGFQFFHLRFGQVYNDPVICFSGIKMSCVTIVRYGKVIHMINHCRRFLPQLRAPRTNEAVITQRRRTRGPVFLVPLFPLPIFLQLRRLVYSDCITDTLGVPLRTNVLFPVSYNVHSIVILK